MTEPLDPVEILATASREVSYAPLPAGGFHLVDILPELAAAMTLLGCHYPGPELAPLRADTPADPTAFFRTLLSGHDAMRYIEDPGNLSESQLVAYPEFHISPSTPWTRCPVRALGRRYLYTFRQGSSAADQAETDPLLAEFGPRALGGGLLSTCRDAAPLFRSLGAPLTEDHPDPTLAERVEIARNIVDLGDLLTPAGRDTVARAVALGTGVVITYRDSHGEESTRLVTNPSLVNHTLLRGHCHLRGEDRIFRLDHVRQALPVD